MQIIFKLLLGFVKGIVLLTGMAMLVGGGLCSASIPFLDYPKDSLVLTWIIVLAVTVVGLTVFLVLKLSFEQLAKYIILLISGLFLIGGSLCSTNSSPQQLNGLLLIDIAVALSGYLLIRWMLSKKNKSPHE